MKTICELNQNPGKLQLQGIPAVTQVAIQFANSGKPAFDWVPSENKWTTHFSGNPFQD